ncbi:YciI family protein [Limnohabitans sp. Hippo4]|uniref:YciI family protein n=1 Tax=Limnohabitans sp. Hippo4 TaxID=1826167 RepID=UPI000D36DC5B|nr:YciI family protein [Limnohabitans sp. Hippo4]PUE36199.1 hypothetical protein B9Z46_05510 [Limnohabitans sp. Hippo4]
MLKKFIIFVIDDLSGSGTPEEMVAIVAFNDYLRDKGHWIFAGGLTAPVHANVIDNRNDSNFTTGKPLFDTKENYSGFWLIQANDDETAKRLAFEGSKACHRRVELRPLLG